MAGRNSSASSMQYRMPIEVAMPNSRIWRRLATARLPKPMIVVRAARKTVAFTRLTAWAIQSLPSPWRACR